MSATNNHNYAEKNVNMNPTIFLSIKPLLKEMATAQYSIYIYYFLSYLAIEQRFLVCFIKKNVKMLKSLSGYTLFEDLK